MVHLINRTDKTDIGHDRRREAGERKNYLCMCTHVIIFKIIFYYYIYFSIYNALVVFYRLYMVLYFSISIIFCIDLSHLTTFFHSYTHTHTHTARTLLYAPLCSSPPSSPVPSIL